MNDLQGTSQDSPHSFKVLADFQVLFVLVLGYFCYESPRINLCEWLKDENIRPLRKNKLVLNNLDIHTADEWICRSLIATRILLSGLLAV